MQRRHLAGGALLMAGAVLLSSAFWPAKDPWQIERAPLPVPGDLVSHYPPTGFERLEIRHSLAGKQLTLYLAHYQDASGAPRQAMLPEPKSRQWQAWMELAQVLHTLEPDALLLTWWDNGQRVDFLSGRAVWALKPPREAFSPRERPLWLKLSGGFEDSEKLIQLAKWWGKDSTQALQEIARLGQPIYFLVSSQDLARAEEIERLAEGTLPLEMRIFPTTSHLHSQIAAVQRWAQETGSRYLPQRAPGGIIAWRLKKAPATLLLRLLPFLPPLDQAADSLKLIYQSPDRYLTLYRH
ncbi:MAG: hypothetical protein N3A55_00795 [Methylohalobius sp.]|nr:hypothetical protein [Methylohalobius sp.]